MKLSIVVPAYNVEKYIDQCLESLCKQTYRDFEIIIVYDKSTDATLEICEKWVEQDNRIKLIVNERRGGLGAARNVGIMDASGEYIMYLDSDDWFQQDYVARMMTAIEDSDTQLVIDKSIKYVTSDDVRISTVQILEGEYKEEIDPFVVLLTIWPAVWTKIYNREWLINNNLLQPEIFHFEDWGYNGILFTKTSHIAVVDIGGVYHRIGREDSLSNANYEKLYADFERAIRFICNGVRGFDSYRKDLLYYFLVCYKNHYIQCEKKDSPNALNCIDYIYNKVLRECFDFENEIPEWNMITYGSFSVKWIVQQILNAKTNDSNLFSSLIAGMTEGELAEPSHENVFRKQMLERDFRGDLYRQLKEITEETYLVMDFIGECNSIIRAGDNYVTNTEAYQECNFNEPIIGECIQASSEEHKKIWKQKCDEFIEILGLQQDKVHVVYVKNRYATEWGNWSERTPYENVEEIQQKNALIKEFEEYFLDNYSPEAVIDIPSDYFVTDKEFRYGIEPQYMSTMAYKKVAKDIFKELIKE